MFTRKSLKPIIHEFILDLKSKGYNPSKVVLFGSYAKGHPREHSDIDLAIWDDKFTGCIPQDVESLIKLKVKFPSLLELHTYHSSETEDSDPFIGEIEKHGILIDSKV
jgi:predicted nucleotidyltransferase